MEFCGITRFHVVFIKKRKNSSVQNLDIFLHILYRILAPSSILCLNYVNITLPQLLVKLPFHLYDMDRPFTTKLQKHSINKQLNWFFINLLFLSFDLIFVQRIDHFLLWDTLWNVKNHRSMCIFYQKHFLNKRQWNCFRQLLTRF